MSGSWCSTASLSPDLPNSLQTPGCKHSDKELQLFTFTQTKERGRAGARRLVLREGKERKEGEREGEQRGNQSAFVLKGTDPPFSFKAMLCSAFFIRALCPLLPALISELDRVSSVKPSNSNTSWAVLVSAHLLACVLVSLLIEQSAVLPHALDPQG